jgi:DNA-binding response OmpR family regulator
MRLLLVEPYAPLARALRRGLQEEGFVVDEARDRAEAEARLGGAAYDGVVIDLDPPAGEGLRLLRAWRGQGVTTPALLVVLPGEAADAACQGCAGCAVIVKPFDLAALIDSLRRLVSPG